MGVIKSVDLKSIKIIADVSECDYSEIDSIKRNEDSEKIYSIRNFLVKCDMEVYNENDYYFNGNNYASIICGFVNGELRVIDDKLPLPDEVAEYEPDKTSMLDYINNRFTEERPGLYLSDKFTDEYKETATYNGIMPSSIKVLRLAKNRVETVNFKQYCRVVMVCEEKDMRTDKPTIKKHLQ